jgi:hypothetical protein
MRSWKIRITTRLVCFLNHPWFLLANYLCTPLFPFHQLLHFSPPHNNLNNIVIVTLPPDIVMPKPFPPSPNILTRPRLRNPHFPPNHNSPDILAPLPLPLKPNISIRNSFQMFEDEHYLKGTGW